MVVENEYLKRVIADVEKRNAGEKEFLQAVTEVLGSPRIVTVAAISQDSNPATPNVSTNMEEF